MAEITPVFGAVTISSTDPVITVLLDESADFIAVFRDENP